jgi:ribonuclease PH
MSKSSSSLRPLKFQKNYLPHAEGSCLVSMGNTKVLCVASVENRVPPHAEEKSIGWVHGEYAMLPRAGESRSNRKKAGSGGRVQEISRLVGRALRAAVNLPDLFPYSIVIDCDVIRADGGTRTASVNGGFIALVQALRGLQKKGALPRWPLKHFIGAVSVGIVKGKPMLDICYAKDKNAETDLNVVMTGDGRLIEVQGTAEAEPFSKEELSRMLAMARAGIRKITAQQKKALGAIVTR